MSKMDSMWAPLRGVKQWGLTHRYLLAAVALPLVVRTIPEILAGPWPLGFDTVWVYAPFVKEVETQGIAPALSRIGGEQAAPLMYTLLALSAGVTQATPFAITKAAAPSLYGALGFSLYYFARRGLGWDNKSSLWFVIISTLYFVPLRFSWDMYKNTLGLVFFFLAISHVKSFPASRDTRLVLGLSALSILSSELMAVLISATFGLLFVWDHMQHGRRRLDILALFAAGLVATLFYLHMIVPPNLPATPLAPPPMQSGILYNYVGSNQDIYVYPTLLDVYASVLVLTVFLFAPIGPLVYLGLRREKRLAAMTAFLGVGSFSILVSPFAALPAWHRWLFMLAFPALVFATLGFLRLGRKLRAVFLAVLILMGASYVALPGDEALPYYDAPQTFRYVPPSLLKNTVLITDCPDVVRVLTWLNEQRVADAILVAHITFVGWAELYVDTLPVYGFLDPIQVDAANLSAYNYVYVLDWARQGSESPQPLLPDGAVEVFASGRIAVYEIAS